jgi:hypothetical protein
MNNCIIGTYAGTPVVSLGIMKIPYDKKEIIQKASYYLAGIQYEKCNGCLFYSGEYYLEPFTEELSNLDVHNFMMQDKRLDEETVRNMYKYIYVKIILSE